MTRGSFYSTCNFDGGVDWSGCSIPECDHERVKGKFPDWSNDVIKQCSESNKITEKLKSDGCFADCVSKEEERLNQERRKLAVSKTNTSKSRIIRSQSVIFLYSSF